MLLFEKKKKILEVTMNGGKRRRYTAEGSIHLPLYTVRFLSSWTLMVSATGYLAHHDVYVTTVVGRVQTVLKNHTNRRTIRQTKATGVPGESVLDRVQTWKAFFH